MRVLGDVIIQAAHVGSGKAYKVLRNEKRRHREKPRKCHATRKVDEDKSLENVTLREKWTQREA